MKARNAEHYRKAWSEHISSFQNVAIEADLPYEDWLKLKAELEKLVDTAADRLAEDGFWSDSDIAVERTDK